MTNRRNKIHHADEEWRLGADCQQADPRMFDIEYAFRTIAIVRHEYCDHCPVKRQCLLYGRRSKSDGIWGGEILEDGRYAKTRVLTKAAEVG